MLDRNAKSALFQPHAYLSFLFHSYYLRYDKLTLVEPSKAPRLGKGGSPESRVAILHSLAHIESWAIDLSWDVIARFGQTRKMPKQFFDDFVNVAVDEARHFTLLSKRLESLGSNYGALNAHDGLWNSATETSQSLEARLVIEHCVHEARGLDVLPATIKKFRNNGDEASADLLEKTIYPEEITHCAAGVKWFTYLCTRGDASCGDFEINDRMLAHGEGPLDDGDETNCENDVSSSTTKEIIYANPEPPLPPSASVTEKFNRIAWRHFRGVLKPPFNDDARANAGFGKEWYEPLQRRPEWELKGPREEQKEIDAFFEAKKAKEAAERAAEEAKAAQAKAIEDTNRRIFLL